jgi:hypothetical protein
VQHARAPPTGATAEPHAPRLITGCWLRLAHHSLFTAAFGSASKQQCSPVRISLYPFGCPGQHNVGHTAKRKWRAGWVIGSRALTPIIGSDPWTSLAAAVAPLPGPQEGVTVCVARENRDAINLVITEAQMPRLNGSDLCTHL